MKWYTELTIVWTAIMTLFQIINWLHVIGVTPPCPNGCPVEPLEDIGGTALVSLVLTMVWGIGMLTREDVR